ncbi:MAG: hypothetical protein SGPRY_012427, partial [Prymnesium sp.]
MEMDEWVYAICRLAWETFPTLPENKRPSICERVDSFMRMVVQPACSSLLSPPSSLPPRLFTRRVKAIAASFNHQLRDIFSSYARADRRHPEAARRHNAMNVSELVLMLADGAMLGSQLSSKVVASVFQHVCTLSQGDESELELSFEEFDTLLAWLCDRTLTDEERKKVEQEPAEFES